MKDQHESAVRRMPHSVIPLAAVIAVCFSWTIGSFESLAETGDWPTYRHDAQRSGYTSERLGADLALHWIFQAPHAPDPAWRKHGARMTYDRGYHPVVSGSILLFGSSSDDTIYALDTGTGKVLWTYTTSGPIRFAPTVSGESVFFVSDDGCLYSLSLRAGSLNWKVRAGPTDSRVLGNRRVISRWPARGAPVVVDGTVYFAAGVWPSEGFFLYAVDADSGKVKWLNEETGSVIPAQPHAGIKEPMGGVSAQGYLAICKNTLIVPTGRSVPAIFRRLDGSLVYSRGRKHHWHIGGPDVVVFDDYFLNDYLVFNAHSGHQDGRLSDQIKEKGRRHWSGKRPNLIVAHPDGLARWTGDGITWFGWEEKVHTDRKGRDQTERALVEMKKFDAAFGGTSLAMAGNTLISAGKHQDRAWGVALIDMNTASQVGHWRVAGEPEGLAVAAGRLFVSTTEGMIYCFGSGDQVSGPVTKVALPVRSQQASSKFRDLAKRIVQETGIREGFCVDLGCGGGELAQALAEQTDLHIVAIDPEQSNVEMARKRLSQLGLYGARVTVLCASLEATELPPRWVNLVVSQRSTERGLDAAPIDEAERLVRPYGGRICLGAEDDLLVRVAGPLEGAGQWTHQYADPGNTAISQDMLVKAPLGMVWYDDHGWTMPSRHGRGPAPLYFEGLMYVEGMNGILCVDAFNGRRLWTYEIPGILKAYNAEHILGAAGTGSNLCVGSQGLFVRTENKCLRIDRLTGQLIEEYEAPPGPDGQPAPWGFIALSDGVLFGSVADAEHIVKYPYGNSDMKSLLTESRLLFALDTATGRLLWTFEPRESIRHNAIAIGNGHVYLIDRPQATADRLKEQEARRGKTVEAPSPGRLVALQASDGAIAWETEEDIYGTMLILSTANDALMMSYQKGLFQLKSEKGGRMTVFQASTGARRWDKAIEYHSRPVVTGRTIYAQTKFQGDTDKSCAWDLINGEDKDFRFARYRRCCGTVTGSPNLLMFRSAQRDTRVNALAYVDLLNPQGTEKFAGLRPGCWLNTIAAGGMVLMPDASDGCSCSFQMKASIALQHFGVRPPRIEPRGAASVEPIQVRLESDVEGAHIHYTTDGSNPTTDSPKYDGPITIGESVTIRARTVINGMPPSSVVRASFTLLSAEEQGITESEKRARELAARLANNWRVVDAPGGVPPSSQWVLEGDAIVEKSNLYSAIRSEPGQQDTSDEERRGTYRLFRANPDLTAGELTLDIGSSDRDTLGVVFRFRDPDHYYVWYMDGQPFHRLAVKNAGQYRVLAKNKRGYTRGQWHQLRIVLDRSRIVVFFDGKKDFEVTDNTLEGGTFGLYAWGSAGAKFKNINWLPKAAAKE